MFEKLKTLSARLDELEMRLSAPDLYDDPDRAARLLRERNELEPIVERTAHTSGRSSSSPTRPRCCPTRT